MSLLSLVGGAGITGAGLQPGQPGAGFAPLKRLRQPMLEVAAAAPATGTTATRVARILTPGPELIVAFSLAFEPKTPQGITDYTATPSWAATAMRSGSAEGGEARLHALFAAQVLPQLYQCVGIIADIEISAVLTVPRDAAVAGIPGQWVLEATWGAAMVLCPEDREFLFNLCAIKAPSSRVGLLIP